MSDGKSSSVWSPEEDAELARLQEIHGNRWALVAAELPGKTGQQCAQRWRHKVNPAIKKEKWTPEEDAQLAKLYEQHGQRWAEIARHLEGRTDQQCMGRWRRHLDPSVKKDAWTDPEDKKLMSLHESLGPRWSNISKMLTGRTAQQCRARWFQLSAADDDALSEGTTVSAAAAGSEGGKTLGSSSGKKRPKTALKTSNLGRTPTPPISPSTPAVTDEVDGAVASGRGDLNRGTVSKKRGVGSVLGAPVAKRRRSAMEKGNNKGGNQSDTSSSGSGYGNGGGLDLLAMLYSAAVTYETSVVAAGAGMKSFPPELYA
mmetsp:Transcript_10783/g.44897  ORF Transcript_10783/g.44897 Transcript_10783/m.44897 type:complete len:315 (+) Transcript_10783:314-1258(+)